MTLHPIAVTDGALKTTPPDPEKVRQTARGFEGLFLSQLIKIMKNSIPKDEKQGMLSSGTMTEFADMELGRVLADSTAKMLGVQNVWDPEQNIQGGARYVRKLMDQFDQQLEHALAAYHAGPTAVTRHGGISPYAKTQKYVKRVLNLFYGKPPAAIYGT
jgi:hypothetical protein